MRMRPKQDAGTEVPLSPLIDCVFLLLIFFLVTSMIKRYERQIPVTLADPTAAISTDTQEDAFRFGIDREGQAYAQTGDRSKYGVHTYAPINDLPTFLQTFDPTHGTQSPIELVVQRGTRFQTVIDTLDIFELQGFDNVRSRIKDGRIRTEED